MTLPKIETELTAKNGQFDRAMDASDRRVGAFQKTADATSRRLGQFGDRMTSLGRRMSAVSAGVVVAGGALFAMAQGTAAAGNRIDKQSKAAGLSAEAFQELGFAIGQVSEVTEQQFGKAMSRLTRSMGDAANGMAAPLDAFEQLGISQEELQSGTVTTEEAFNRMVAALQDMETPAQAAAVAAQILGREGAMLGPILREAGGDIEGLRSRARELGIVLSGDTVKASAEFTDQMDILSRQMRALRDQVGAALLPVLTNSLIPALQDKVIPALGALAQKVANIITWFGDLPGPVQEAASFIAGALGVGGPVLLAVGALSKALAVLVAASGPIGLFIAAAGLLAAAWYKWGDDIKEAIGTAVDFVSERFTAMVLFVESIPEKMVQVGQNIVDGLRAGIAERWESFKEYMYSLLPEIPEWARDVLGIQSPSRVFAELGGYIGEGLAQGISQSQALVNRSVSQLANGAVNQTDGMVSQILGSMSQLFAGSKEIAIAQAAINLWQGATEALKLPFPANLAAFAQTVATGMGAVNAIQSTSIGSASTGAATAATSAAPAAPQAPVDFRISGIGEGDLVRFSTLETVFDQMLEIAGDRGIRPVFGG